MSDKRTLQRCLVVLVSLLTVVAGCASNPLEATPATIEAARPAQSPPVAQNPAGTIRPLAGHAAAAVLDAGSHLLAVLIPGADGAAPASLAVLGPGPGAPRVIALPGPAAALTGDDWGTA
jgi:type IV pilus biogenesis protein CpaD/CtpE